MWTITCPDVDHAIKGLNSSETVAALLRSL